MFFELSDIATRHPPLLVPQCGACGIYRSCNSPKMPVTGQGRMGVLIIGEAPGEQEDSRNSQFVGPAGQMLREVLTELGIDLDVDCWKTNALICRPTSDNGKKIENRTPTVKEMEYCRPTVLQTIERLNPKVIIPLGAIPVRSLIGHLWKEDVGKIFRWAGWKIPSQALNAWICPNFHPSYVLRSRDNADKNHKVLRLWFKRYLSEAFELQSRPWTKVPKYKNDVRIELDQTRAAIEIRKFIERGGVYSLDYETNMLKPDRKNREIVSCAISDGKETLAYPWLPETRQATFDLLTSGVPKIGANTKFETRWSYAEFGSHPGFEDWKWDCMTNAHVLDNRPSISSVKFQAFARLGQPSWDEYVKPYFKTANKDGSNRIREIDMRSLLIYNGIDALVEFKIAVAQRKEYRDRGGVL